MILSSRISESLGHLEHLAPGGVAPPGGFLERRHRLGELPFLAGEVGAGMVFGVLAVVHNGSHYPPDA
jgi:hypothetical protein